MINKVSCHVTTQYSSVSVFLLDDRPIDTGHDGAVPDPDHRLPHSTRGFPEDPVHPCVSGRRRPVTATAHTAAGGAGGTGMDTLIHACFFALYFYGCFYTYIISLILSLHFLHFFSSILLTAFVLWLYFFSALFTYMCTDVRCFYISSLFGANLISPYFVIVIFFINDYCWSLFMSVCGYLTNEKY